LHLWEEKYNLSLKDKLNITNCNKGYWRMVYAFLNFVECGWWILFPDLPFGGNIGHFTWHLLISFDTLTELKINKQIKAKSPLSSAHPIPRQHKIFQQKYLWFFLCLALSDDKKLFFKQKKNIQGLKAQWENMKISRSFFSLSCLQSISIQFYYTLKNKHFSFW
jgi:hypothetical protein